MRIALFIACYNDTLFPETGKAVVRVLERLGHTVTFPAAQTCCGQMHWNTGYREEALPLVRRFVEQFRDAEAVVVPSSSCVAMMQDHYPGIAAQGDTRLVTEVAALLPRVYEFSALLTDRLQQVDVGACYPHRVTYHASCHGLRNLALGEGPLTLLGAVQGIHLVPLERVEQCCGFGGTFAIKNPEVSGALLEDKVRAILATGAEVCTACDNSCLMHLGGALHRQGAGVGVLHLAQILASSEAEPR